MKDDVILRTITKFMLPFIQIFAFYTLAHGEISPGGGFQAGVIFGASFILIALVFGKNSARSKMPRNINDILLSTGDFIYAFTGLFCIFAGGLFLEYGKLPFHSAKEGNHIGMIIIELGVAITVAAVMMTIFFEIAGKEDD
jgi:multicomponent Na+:H+ antiporter subunit B